MNTNLKTIFTLCLLTALQSSQASSIPLPTPSTQYNKQILTPIDLSKIKKDSEVNHSPYEWKCYKDPKIAVYTLSNGKEFWFLLDNHYDSRWITCVDTLIREENFTHGIIEFTTDSPDSCTFTETVEDAKHYSTLSWWKKFKHNIYDPWFGKSTMGHALVLLQQQNKIIKPGEYDSFEQTYAEWKKRGLCLNDIQYMKKLKKNYSTASEQDKKTYEDLFETMIHIRDEKIARTIFETMQDETATKVLIVYGAAHWCTLEKCLEHSFEKPTIISFNQYRQEKIMKKIEQILQLPITTTLLDLYMFHRI